MKKKQFLMASLAASALLAAQIEKPNTIHANESSSTIEYVENDVDKQATQETGSEANESMTIDEINELEGIPQEQIVVAIEPDGYVTSHGDHFHFYNGSLPEDALFSEDIQTSEDYQLNEADIVGEIHGAKIVLIDEVYLIHNELGEEHPGLRTVEEIYLQSFSVHPDDARALVELMDLYQLPEDSEIFYETDRLLKELTKELQEKDDTIEDPVLIYITPEEYAVLLGMDIYVLPGKPSDDIAVSELFITDVNYELDPADIVFETVNGVIVEIDGKHYFHPASREQVTVVAFHNIEGTVKKAHDAFIKADGKRADDKHQIESGSVVHESGSRNSSGQYVTDDGYVFSPYHVLRDTGSGYIVPHDDHFHFIPKSDLTAEEIAIADSVLGNRSGGVSNDPIRHSLAQGSNDFNKPMSSITVDGAGNKIIHLDENTSYHEESGYVTSDGYRFTVESVTEILDDGILGRHDDHFHYVPFAHLNKRESAELQSYAKDKFGVTINLPGESASHTLSGREDRPSQTATDRRPAFSVKKDSGNTRNNQGRLVAEDGFVFNPREVIRKVANGYIAPHDDHYHFIPASEMTAEEIRIAEATLGGGVSNDKYQMSRPGGQSAKQTQGGKITKVKKDKKSGDKKTTASNQLDIHKDDQPKTSTTGTSKLEDQSGDIEHKKPLISFKSLRDIKKTSKGKDGETYVTSDGYVFDAKTVVDFTSAGVIALHDGPKPHYHFIPFADLDESELLALVDAGWLTKKSTVQSESNEKQEKPKENANIENQNSSSESDNNKEDEIGTTEEDPELVAQRKAKKDKIVKKLERLLEKIYALQPFQRYYQTDGFYFDPAQVKGKTEEGYIVSVIVDGEIDERVVPFGPLQYYERDAANLRLQLDDYKPLLVDPLSEGVTKEVKPLLRDKNGGFDELTEEQIQFNIDNLLYDALIHVTEEDNGWFVQPHNDHYHYVPFRDLRQDDIDFTRYLIQNPQYVPENNNGWGRDAEIFKNPDKFKETVELPEEENKREPKPQNKENSEEIRNESTVKEDIKTSDTNPAPRLETVSREDLRQYIATTYNLPLDHVRRFVGQYIVNQPGVEENIIITKEEALQAYHGYAQLPPILKIDDDNIVENESEETKEQSEDKKQAEESNDATEKAEEKSETTPIKEEKVVQKAPAKDPSRVSKEEIKQFLANSYDLPIGNVSNYGKTYVVRQPGVSTNTIVFANVALKAYLGEGQLPPLATDEALEEEMTEQEITEEESAGEEAQDESTVTVETLINFLAQHYGVATSQISYSNGSFVIYFEDQSLTIAYDLALSAYHGNSGVLPSRPAELIIDSTASEEQTEEIIETESTNDYLHLESDNNFSEDSLASDDELVTVE